MAQISQITRNASDNRDVGELKCINLTNRLLKSEKESGNKMLLILEGCDGSGKTAIADQLSAWWADEVIHCTRETPNNFHFFYNIIRRAKFHNIVADRFCYGQFVYQPPEERPLSPSELCVLEGMMGTDAKLLYVYAARDEIEQRLAARDEVVAKGVDAVLKRYQEIFYTGDSEGRLLLPSIPIIPVYTGSKKGAIYPWLNC